LRYDNMADLLSLPRPVERPPLTDGQLNGLYAASWPRHARRRFQPVLQRSLTWFAALDEATLVGFVYVAWDGGLHAFLLDPTVLPSQRQRGLGTALVRAAIGATQRRGIEWLHVDYEAGLERFYAKAGFRPSAAGILRLADD
jgi:GNAT superfamily N-acetyltransferase